jgi:hypothetical protein
MLVEEHFPEAMDDPQRRAQVVYHRVAERFQFGDTRLEPLLVGPQARRGVFEDGCSLADTTIDLRPNRVFAGGHRTADWAERVGTKSAQLSSPRSISSISGRGPWSVGQ